MMRIAILHYAAPPVIGGVEVTIFHHARLLAGEGYGVRVIAGRGEPFHPEVEFVRIPEADSRHPEVLEIGRALALGQVPERFSSLRDRLVGELRSHLEDVRVCLVHNAVTLHKNLPLTAALRRLSDEGTPRFIAWCHDFAWMDELYVPELHPGYPWDLLCTPWPGVLYVAVSEHRRARLAELLDLPPDQIRVVNPGVDLEKFLKLDPVTRRLVDKLDLLSADPLLLCPARITRRKNIEFAIRVTAALVSHAPRATLVVTGPPGPHNPKNIAYLNALQELRAELGVEERVHFLYAHGEDDRPLHVSASVLADLYQLADALLFPSRREGFGIPVLEAGLFRLPIFAADIPPIREIVGELGHLFDPQGDPQRPARAILDHFNADPLYRFRRRVVSRYTWGIALKNDLIPMIEERNEHVSEP